MNGAATVPADERVIRYTFFRARNKPVGLPMVTEPGELAASLASPLTVGPGGKEALPLISWATFRGNRRTLATVEAVHALGLDVDDPTADPAGLVETVRAALGGVELYAHSTASSEPGAYRMRIIVPYDEPATAEEHRASWALVACLLDRVSVEIDRTCVDPSRAYYVPAMPTNGVYWHAALDGTPWPVRAAAELEHGRQATEAAERSSRRPSLARPSSSMDAVERARRYLERVEPAIAGAGGHRATYVAALKVLSFGIGEDEAFALLAEEFNPRCVPPWSDRDLRRKVNEATKARSVSQIGCAA